MKLPKDQRKKVENNHDYDLHVWMIGKYDEEMRKLA